MIDSILRKSAFFLVESGNVFRVTNFKEERFPLARRGEENRRCGEATKELVPKLTLLLLN